jgi:hypothetical protein
VVQNPSLIGNPPPVPLVTKLLQQALVAEHGGNTGRRVPYIACGTQGKSFFIVEMKRASLFRKKREQCLPDLAGVLQGTSMVGKKNMVGIWFLRLLVMEQYQREMQRILSKGLVTMRCMSRKGFSGTKRSF